MLPANVNNKLHPETKEKWLAALKSGNYEFHASHFRRCDVDNTCTNDKCMCALGVLLDIDGYWQRMYSYSDADFVSAWDRVRQLVGLEYDTVYRVNDSMRNKNFRPVVVFIEQHL